MMLTSENLRLPVELWRAYREELEDCGLLEQALSDSDAKKIFGGQTKEKSDEFFCHRFTASCSRITYLVLKPKSVFAEASKQLLLCCQSGSIAILDVAGGSGAATLSLLSSIAHLRTEGTTPKLPLNVRVLNADFSVSSQAIAQSLHIRLNSTLSQAGIHLTYGTVEWDAHNVEQTAKLCDDFFDHPEKPEVYIVVTANISGDGNPNFQKISESLKAITYRSLSKTCLSLWIEPDSGGGVKLLRKLQTLLGAITGFGTPGGEQIPTVSYRWMDDLKKRIHTSGIALQNFGRTF